MNNYSKWLKAGAIGLVAIIGFNACSDDWNDHYDINSNASTSSLWQNISNNAKLTNFAKILESVKVSKSETRITNITYKDLLSSGSTFTVWAPENGTYNADSIIALINSGKSYNVEIDFIQNHMARFNHPATGTIDEDITMYNSKVSHFAGSGSTYTLKTTQLDMANSNVGSSNGTLHTLVGQSSFKPNLYELIATTTGLDSLYKFFKENEIIKFNENASTEGPTIDGKPTYVDSVFYTTSTVSNALGISPSNEDSLYAMVMPTNAAWISGLEKTKPLYQYRSTYVQAIPSTDDTGKETITNVTTNINADSMQTYLAKFALIKAGVFNARYQNGVVPSQYTSPATYDSLKTTTGLTLYNNDPVKGMTVASDIFDNQTPAEASNGYAFVVNNWKYQLNKTLEKDIDILGNSYNLESFSQCTYSSIYVGAGEQNPDVKGQLLYNDYIDFVPSTTAANPVATFKISSVLSGTYDIYAVVVPENITNTRLVSVLPNRFKATLTYYADATKSTTTTAISKESGNYLRDESSITSDLQSGTVQAVDSAGVATDTPIVTNKVDSVLLFRNFKFPISYYGLSNAYVTLKLQSTIKTKETKMYSREFRINQILLRAKDE
jgi:transposase-like protein